MLDSEYIKLHLNKDITVESNFNEASTPYKIFKFSLGDKSTFILRDELFGLLFLFGDEKQQEDLIPVISTKVRTITRLLSFKLKKDMRKGQIVRAPYTYFMPEAIVEKLLISDPKRYRKSDLLTYNKLIKHVNKIV